jgi:hypothetical protein
MVTTFLFFIGVNFTLLLDDLHHLCLPEHVPIIELVLYVVDAELDFLEIVGLEVN